MYIYKDLDKYFEKCLNCGECCKIPGVLLPEQIDILANHFNFSRRQLFDRYLIAELCAPNDSFVPAFVLSPVKVDVHGNRLPNRIFDDEYVKIRHLNCIFRNNEAKVCSIHSIKPFACALLICAKMTKDKSIELNKTHYYYKWINSQDIVFSMFPELVVIYQRLIETISQMPKLIDIRNKIINVDIATVFNGHPITGMPIYA